MIDDNKPKQHALIAYAESVNEAIANLRQDVKNLQKRVKELEDERSD